MSAPLSIVQMIPALTKGGAERVAVDLANAGARAGHVVTVVAGWKVDEQVLRVRLDPAVRVKYMRETTGGRLQRYVAGFVWVLRNRQWLAEQDVVHVHLTQSSIFGTLIYSLRNWTEATKPAVIETYHSVGMKISDWARAFHAWNCCHRDGIAVMALDPYWRSFIARRPGCRAELIPNGVDAPVGAASPYQVRAYLDAIGVPSTANRIIGNVGQFRADRQPQIVARILIDVLKRTPENVHAMMCGSGPELDVVRALVANAGMVERFTLPGVVNDPRLAISAMHVFLTLNVGSITGVAALEAAFCCVPVVALQLDSTSNLTTEEWIWSSAAAEVVSERIKAMLDDSEGSAQVAARQHKHAISEHSIDEMFGKYLSLYRGVIAARSASLSMDE